MILFKPVRLYSSGAKTARPTSLNTPLTQSGISKYFNISYARSSGAGGQHVNTTDSKAVIKLRSSEWYASRGTWIPTKTFDVIMQNLSDPMSPALKKFPFFTPSGDVQITSSTTRYRDKNLAECFTKFIDAVTKCSQEKQEVDLETKQRWSKLKKKDNENRLRDKKHRKDKKSSRGKISMGDY